MPNLLVAIQYDRSLKTMTYNMDKREDFFIMQKVKTRQLGKVGGFCLAIFFVGILQILYDVCQVAVFNIFTRNEVNKLPALH